MSNYITLPAEISNATMDIEFDASDIIETVLDELAVEMTDMNGEKLEDYCLSNFASEDFVSEAIEEAMKRKRDIHDIDDVTIQKINSRLELLEVTMSKICDELMEFKMSIDPPF